MEYEFEVVEKYVLQGERRFRVRVKGTRIVVNIAADSVEEAVEKARAILERVDAERVLRR
ncbi:MAG: hypothetical protein F7C08_00215 [Desulfurococcales archaeon]|nr:hypothetical protein [Desulfurococcales archaeon]MCE4604952.1 hypothetical protein [Desulfurococcales archaeon]